METKFIEQLVTTAPESLREITHTLRVDVEALLKAKSTNLKSATPFPKCYLQEKWTFDS